MLTDQSMYEICGEVEKIKVKENYKNHTAYVTFRSTQAAATAFIVPPPARRPSIKSTSA